MSQLKPAYEPIPPLDERKMGLNRWQYLVVLSLAWLILKFWPSQFQLVYGLLITFAMVLLATLSRLENIGRPVFCLANVAYLIGGFIILSTFSSFISHWFGEILAACVLVVLLSCIYLPPRYEIHRQMDLAGYLLITLLILLAGGFTFWCYR